MEIERYKMIYSTKNKKEVKKEINHFKKRNKEELNNKNIIILGHTFVKNNKNKAKLIINNKKSNLKEYINIHDYINDQIKINMILNKSSSNRSYMFENCEELIELSIFDNITKSSDEIQEFEDKENYNEYDIDYNKETNDDLSNLYKYIRSDNISFNYSENSMITKVYEIQNIIILYKSFTLNYN